jgi:deoxyhypusine synthase
MNIREFIERHYLHFNAGALRDAAQAYEKHLAAGGKMFMTLAGAMSTAELGLSLAEMIRRGLVHGISCTGANLEEDLYNLVAHDFYRRIPNYRDLTPEDEARLCSEDLRRVTDTCIPEEEAMRRLDGAISKRWSEASEKGQQRFVHEFFYDVLLSGELKPHYQIDPKNSWMIAAAEKKLPMFVPGWEDSTLGNGFVGHLLRGTFKDRNFLRFGLDYMQELVRWYRETSRQHSLGFFQIGGGIAGDFPICVVPLIKIDLGEEDIPSWGYFCQISDSTTSYGSYSGAVPNEKITWKKLDVDTPKFVIESDATIVAPLIFAYLLKW